MLELVMTKQFKRDLKKIKSSNKDISLLENVVDMLLAEQQLPAKYEDHALKGNLKGFRECHIQSNWLLVYYIEHKTLVLTLVRTGSHNVALAI